MLPGKVLIFRILPNYSGYSQIIVSSFYEILLITLKATHGLSISYGHLRCLDFADAKWSHNRTRKQWREITIIILTLTKFDFHTANV